MHIVCFNLSAISLIGQLPKVKKELQSILPFGDDLSFGPIVDVLSPEREMWHSDFLKSRFAFSYEQTTASWKSNVRRYDFVSAGNANIQVWLSRNSITELCGFSEFLCQFPEKQEFEIVDFTDFKHGPWATVSSIGHLSLEALGRGSSQVRKSNAKEWQSLITNWKNLKSENANLRISRLRIPESAPETYYDRKLLSQISNDWMSAHRVISALIIDEEHQHSMPSWDVLSWRTLNFSQLGIVEIRNSEFDQIAEVRLRPIS
jgi:hypothetical protein